MLTINKHVTYFAKKAFSVLYTYSPLTTLPVVSILEKPSFIGWCSMAINSVLSTMQMVMARSTNGSIIISLTTLLIFIHVGHSQMRKVRAKSYHQGGHFCLDSSSSDAHKWRQNKKKYQLSFWYPRCNQDRILLPWCTIPTLHSAGYDTSYTVNSLSGLWAVEEVHKLLSSTGLSVLCISGVSLKVETSVKNATVLQKISYMLPWIYSSSYKRE